MYITENFIYMVFTEHCIDDRSNIQKKIYFFKKKKKIDHKDGSIAKRIGEWLLGWSIENLLTIVLDNSTAVATATDATI